MSSRIRKAFQLTLVGAAAQLALACAQVTSPAPAPPPAEPAAAVTPAPAEPAPAPETEARDEREPPAETPAEVPAETPPSGEASPVEPFDVVRQSATLLPCYDVFELAIRHRDTDAAAGDVAFAAVFTSPDDVRRPVRGFHYGGDTWKLRFRPDQLGYWSFTWTLTDSRGARTEGDGAFDCAKSRAEGPLRRDPKNRFRWISARGTPWFPIGIQDCFGAGGDLKAPLVKEIDGEGRSDGRARRVSLDDYFSIYGDAGFNLFRFSQRNCSFSLIDDAGRFPERPSAVTDELLSSARRHGLRVLFGLFGFPEPRTPDAKAAAVPPDPAAIARDKRFVDYAVARWGVYVDFWELLNEGHASNAWTTALADHVRSVDPDQRPVTTSWEKPSLKAIDINAPHWYESENELESDLRVRQLASQWKSAGKPVLVGEQGNMGMNWDRRSALRMRIRSWTALFQEIGLVFWNTSWAKNGMHGGRRAPGKVANIYLGPEERGYVRALRDVSERLEAGMRPLPIEPSAPARVRAYALASPRVAAAYLHHFESHSSDARGLTVRLELPGAVGARLAGEWIDPATGRLVARLELAPGSQALDVPPFAVDLALVVAPAER